MKDILFVFSAIHAAATAKNIDLTSIAETAAAAGMPKRRLLTTGERTAVKRPTLSPYLYDATSVKK